MKVFHFFLVGVPALLILLPGCSDKEEDLISVQSELQVYFHRFIHEAELRGQTVDLDLIPIVAQITSIDPPQVAGTCLWNPQRENEIEISNSFWNRSGDLQREYVVFHELGHCYLKRGHKETTYKNGACSSIMASGTGMCIPNYNANTRSVYLDELFGR